MINEYTIHLCIIVGIYLILSQSLNLTFGIGRLFNLAHIAAYAIGAYTAALCSTELGMSIALCMLASMLLSGLLAIFLGAIALRLEHDYFAIGTLTFSFVITAILINWKDLTRGVLGIPNIPRPEFVQVFDSDNANFLLLTYLLVFISFTVLWLLFNSPFCRRLKALSEHEWAASSLSVDTRLIRNLAFFVSSSFAGLAGALYAFYINYIDPSSFSIHELILVLSIIVVGGPGKIFGVTLGTFFLILLPEPLRFTASLQPFLEGLLSLSSQELLSTPIVGQIVWMFNFASQPSVLGPMRQLLYAAILLIFLYVRRRSLFPVVREI